MSESATHGLGSEPVQLWTQNWHGLKTIVIIEPLLSELQATDAEIRKAFPICVHGTASSENRKASSENQKSSYKDWKASPRIGRFLPKTLYVSKSPENDAASLPDSFRPSAFTLIMEKQTRDGPNRCINSKDVYHTSL